MPCPEGTFSANTGNEAAVDCSDCTGNRDQIYDPLSKIKTLLYLFDTKCHLTDLINDSVN